MLTRCINLTGQKFGRWLVIERAENSKRGKAMWRCSCRCGNVFVVVGGELRGGHSTQCKSCARTKHGKAYDRLYGIWKKMISRCQNEQAKDYVGYGGRGISICREWLNINTFFRWAYSNKYTKELTIDRIDNNGNYEPNNCRWITNRQQHSNRRDNHWITINDKTKTITQWSEGAGISRTAIRYRERNNWPKEALIEPSNRGKRRLYYVNA